MLWYDLQSWMKSRKKICILWKLLNLALESLSGMKIWAKQARIMGVLFWTNYVFGSPLFQSTSPESGSCKTFPKSTAISKAPFIADLKNQNGKLIRTTEKLYNCCSWYWWLWRYYWSFFDELFIMRVGPEQLHLV